MSITNITAEFVVESGTETLVFGHRFYLSGDEMKDGKFEWAMQRMSRQLSKNIIENTTMLAHLVTHPDDTP